MRPAGRQHPVTIPITPLRTSSDSLRILDQSTLAAASIEEAAAETAIILSPASIAGSQSAAADRITERQRNLAVVIRQRIESRLAGRVRSLAIRVQGKTVVLEGRCATFYTKQLAQHAALGVLEDEQLENAIVVTM